MMRHADCAAQSAASRTAARSTSAGRPPRGSPGRGTTSTLRTLGRLRFTYVFENPIYNTCDMLRTLGRLRCAYVFEISTYHTCDLLRPLGRLRCAYVFENLIEKPILIPCGAEQVQPLLSRRGRSLPATAGGGGTHRDPITHVAWSRYNLYAAMAPSPMCVGRFHLG
eukprot:COSAG01_NODE_10777_length_2080_cov_29.263370_3_plen_167_part_00